MEVTVIDTSSTNLLKMECNASADILISRKDFNLVSFGELIRLLTCYKLGFTIDNRLNQIKISVSLGWCKGEITAFNARFRNSLISVFNHMDLKSLTYTWQDDISDEKIMISRLEYALTEPLDNSVDTQEFYIQGNIRDPKDYSVIKIGYIILHTCDIDDNSRAAIVEMVDKYNIVLLPGKRTYLDKKNILLMDFKKLLNIISTIILNKKD